MGFIKRLFCNHQHFPIENDYIKLGWHRCIKCGHEKYIGDNIEFTEIKFPKIIIK